MSGEGRPSVLFVCLFSFLSSVSQEIQTGQEVYLIKQNKTSKLSKKKSKWTIPSRIALQWVLCSGV